MHMNRESLCSTENGQAKYFIKIFVLIELTVLCIFGLYYFSSGDGLYIRDSDGNIDEFYATGDVGELAEGTVVEQIYTSQMDCITEAGVLVSDYGKELEGNLYVRFEDITAGKLLAEGRYPARDLGEGRYLYLNLPERCEVLRGNQVKITLTSDCAPQNAPTVCYQAGYQFQNAAVSEQSQFLVNGAAVQGAMCIIVHGKNYVWTGSHYRMLIGAAMLGVAVLYWLEVLRVIRGKRSYCFGLVHVLKKYGFLIQQMIERNFKTRYKRSVLGVFWSFLNPLLLMSVQYIVFSTIFRSNIDNYPVYLLSGVVVFNFFNEGVGQALHSIVGNASLITKVYIPKYFYPVTRVLSSGINLLMSLIPLMIAALITGEKLSKAYLMLPYVLICLVIFTIGFGMIMGTAMTFFRDMQFLWGVMSTLWTYVTPLFYPLSIVPEPAQTVFHYNPMLYFVKAVRSIVMEQAAPRPIELAMCSASAAVMLLAGGFIFKRNQDKFVFYI